MAQKGEIGRCPDPQEQNAFLSPSLVKIRADIYGQTDAKHGRVHKQQNRFDGFLHSASL